MSFETILIHRDVPIINGLAKIPTPDPNDSVKELADTLGVVTRLSVGSGQQTGSKHGAQEFIRLPGLQPGESY